MNAYPADSAVQRLLVVDDDELLLRAIERALRRIPNLEVRTVASACEALAMFDKWWPHVVLSDVDLGLDSPTGFSLAGALYAADTKVVLMSGAISDVRRKHAAAVGVELIEKPFEVRPTVARLLGRAEVETAA
jgi:DNA-binding response OmpR family regulator